MGKPSTGEADRARLVEPTGSDPVILTAGDTTAWKQFTGRHSISLWGSISSGRKLAMTGTVSLELSYDGGATAEVATDDDGIAATWSNMVYSGGWRIDEPGVLSRLSCTSGSCYYRRSQ